MNPKQKRFCEEYVVDMNAAQAAVRAGYSRRAARNQGNRLLAKAEIREYIDELLEQLRAESISDAREIMEYLTAVMRGEQTSNVLCMVGEGKQSVIAKLPDQRERLRAAELLGRRYGLFTDRFKLDDSVPVVIVGAENLTD